MKNMYLTHWGGCASHMFEYTLNWPTHVGQCIDNPECICDKNFINTFIIFRTHWPDIPIIDYSYTPSKARDNFQHHHYDTNSVPKIDKDTTVVYLYGNPFNCLLSFYGKQKLNNYWGRKSLIPYTNGRKQERCKWVKKTCYDLVGNYDKINDDWDVNGYLNNGEDLFKWEENFDKWINSETDYAILFIHSEDMWENWDEIVWHLFGKNNLKDDGTKHIKLPEKIQRKSDWTKLPEKTKTKLFNLYGNLYDKVNSLPSVFLKEKK